MAYTVYVLKDNNGKRYVGITSLSPGKRWNNGNGYRFLPELWKSIIENGWDSINKEIVAVDLSKEEASELEKVLIEKYQSHLMAHGYNRELGGLDEYKLVSEDTRQKISQSHIGCRNPNFGVHFTKLHRQKISASNTGKVRSDETKARIGKSKEKPIAQYSRNGMLLAIWESGRKAAICTGVQAGHISKVCKHKRKTAGGFVWAYADK